MCLRKYVGLYLVPIPPPQVQITPRCASCNRIFATRPLHVDGLFVGYADLCSPQCVKDYAEQWGIQELENDRQA